MMRNETHMNMQNIDLLALVERDTHLKKVAGTDGGEWAGSCPFCGGKDRFRLWANADKPHCWCRGCGFRGDAIGYVMRRDGLDFKAAAEQLGIELSQQKKQQRPPVQQPPVNTSDLKDAPCFDPEWQRAADRFVAACTLRLQDEWDRLSAGAYLEGRGITREAAGAAELGVNMTSHNAEWGKVNVWLPRGIVIPWQLPYTYWNIRIRRPNADLKEDENKYMPPAGVSNGLYNAHLITPHKTVIMVEGELDAVLINWHVHRAGMENLWAVATGGTTGGRLLRWVTLVSLARRVLLAFDAGDGDSAGDNAAAWWVKAIGSKAQRLTPTQHDPTDMWKAGESIVDWIRSVLEPAPAPVKVPAAHSQQAMFAMTANSYQGGM